MFVAAAVPSRSTDVAAIVVPVKVGAASSAAVAPVTISEIVAIESVSVSVASEYDAAETYPNAAAVSVVTVMSGFDTVPAGTISGIVTEPSGV